MALAQAASAANTVLKSPATRAGGWQAIKDVLKNKTVVAAALGFGALWLGADHAVQSYYAHQVNQQISNGFCPNPEHGYYVDRHALQTSLTNELLGATRDHYFRVFIGPPCSGKTTLLKHVCKGIGEGAGFVEIGTLPKLTFGEQLGNAIGFRFRAHASTLNTLGRLVAGTKFFEEPDSKVDMLLRAAEALSQAAAAYKAQHGRPFVLIVDGVDRLAVEDTEMLEALQELGKTWAAQQLITLVLVIGDPTTLDAMRKVPAWHRAFLTHLPALSIQESTLVLARGGGINEGDAEHVARVCGGRLQLLDAAGGMLRSGVGMDVVERMVAAWAEREYITSGIMDEGPHQQAGLQVVRALLNNTPKDTTTHNNHSTSAHGRNIMTNLTVDELPSIPIKEWRRIVGSKEAQEALTKGQVFRVLHEEGRVEFDNRAVFAFAVCWLEERLATPLTK